MQRALSIRPSRPTPWTNTWPDLEAVASISCTMIDSGVGLVAVEKTELIWLHICVARADIVTLV